MITDKASTFTEMYIKERTYNDIQSKRVVWQELAKIYNSSVKTMTTANGDLAIIALEILYKNHKITLKETDTMPLKVEVRFNLKMKYEFNICQKDWTNKISSFFGTKPTKTGFIEFDTKYGIQSEESELVLELLNDSYIRENILVNNLYSLILEYDQKTKIYKLLTVKDRNTKDIKALTELIDLEFHIIDNFIKQGLV